jgi:sugar O-acyltransferase (sialic acid O-acetyltransferase NeuD family)
MNVLAIIGAGGLGRDLLELVRQVNEIENRWDEIAFINNGEPADDIEGLKVYALEDFGEKYKSDNAEAIVAVGEPWLRQKIFKDIKDNNLGMPTIIHPNVHVPESALIGKGTIISQGGFVGNNCHIGENVLLMANAIVGHDNVIEEGSIVSANCHIGGMSWVKEYAYIGAGAVIKESIRVGKFSIVTMGSAVFNDVSDEMMVMGCPARAVRKNENHDVFKPKHS